MKASALRQDLLLHADHQRAGQLVEQLSDLVNQRLNDAGISVATSLLARALTARALLAVAAAWWAERPDAPEPETFRALASLVENLPAQFDPQIGRLPESQPR